MDNPSLRPPRLSVYAMTLCSLFTALIIVGAFIRIQFPVVPITLQTLFVVLAALLLGPKYSAVSVGLYLFLGLAGLPVFTKGGGPGYVFQPTFGYLLGFLAAAWVMGTLAEKIDRRNRPSASRVRNDADAGSASGEIGKPFGSKGNTPGSFSLLLRYWGVGMAGIAVIYLVGMVYLYLVMKFYMNTPVGFASLFTVNFLLTITGDVFKCFVAALLAVRLRPVLRSSRRFSA